MPKMGTYWPLHLAEHWLPLFSILFSSMRKITIVFEMYLKYVIH